MWERTLTANPRAVALQASWDNMCQRDWLPVALRRELVSCRVEPTGRGAVRLYVPVAYLGTLQDQDTVDTVALAFACELADNVTLEVVAW